MIGWRWGFLETLGQNELRISLTDTTHIAITDSEISDFNIRHLGIFLKTVFLTFLLLFSTDLNESLGIVSNTNKKTD